MENKHVSVEKEINQYSLNSEQNKGLHEDHSNNHHGPEFWVNIEGQIHNWDHDTITVQEIRDLGKFPAGIEVIIVNLDDNTQRNLTEDEVIELKPGLGFSKKVRYQRGWTV